MSVILGIRGTFFFAMAFFSLASAGFLYYFVTSYSFHYALVFLLSQGPVLAFFFLWFIRVWKDPAQADHTSTMRLNLLSSICLNAFFLYLFLSTGNFI